MISTTSSTSGNYTQLSQVEEGVRSKERTPYSLQVEQTQLATNTFLPPVKVKVKVNVNVPIPVFVTKCFVASAFRNEVFRFRFGFRFRYTIFVYFQNYS